MAALAWRSLSSLRFASLDLLLVSSGCGCSIRAEGVSFSGFLLQVTGSSDDFELSFSELTRTYVRCIGLMYIKFETRVGSCIPPRAQSDLGVRFLVRGLPCCSLSECL